MKVTQPGLLPWSGIILSRPCLGFKMKTRDVMVFLVDQISIQLR